ncbi:hypothetical protein FF1_042422 [Malus domestica]
MHALHSLLEYNGALTAQRRFGLFRTIGVHLLGMQDHRRQNGTTRAAVGTLFGSCFAYTYTSDVILPEGWDRRETSTQQLQSCLLRGTQMLWTGRRDITESHKALKNNKLHPYLLKRVRFDPKAGKVVGLSFILTEQDKEIWTVRTRQTSGGSHPRQRGRQGRLGHRGTEWSGGCRSAGVE